MVGLELPTVLSALVLLVCVGSAHAQSRFTYSGGGGEVNDSHTGLVWRRCSEGQIWSAGTCTGTAATYTHERALAQAKAQSGTAGWRLPNVKELASLTDRTRTSPAIDTTAFPATPANWHWTSTPYAGSASNAWGVSFFIGEVSDGPRLNSAYMRLVR